MGSEGSRKSPRFSYINGVMILTQISLLVCQSTHSNINIMDILGRYLNDSVVSKVKWSQFSYGLQGHCLATRGQNVIRNVTIVNHATSGSSEGISFSHVQGSELCLLFCILKKCFSHEFCVAEETHSIINPGRQDEFPGVT